LAKKDDAEEGEEGLKSSAAEAESFRNFLKPFFADLENFPRRSAWRGMVDAAVALLEAYFREGEDRDAVCAALRELEALDALGQDVLVRQFQEILSEALEGKTLPPGRFQGGGVCVSDLMPTRGLSFRAVFIPGVVEKAFPAAVRQDPLLLDSERKRINENLGEQGGIPLKGSRLREETLLFSLALNSARERLILSYPRLDPSSGRERVPSFFLLRVAEALHGGKMDYGRLEAIPEYRRIPLSSLGRKTPRLR
jgi:ATP-dependent helicase/DNAse subunit B